MRYKVHNEPHYEYESLYLLANIINGKSIKDERDSMIEKRGNSFKSVITPFFKEAIELEKYIKKNLQLNMPGFESTKQTAKFLFKEGLAPDMVLAQFTFAHEQMLQLGIDNKELAILAALNFDLMEKHFGVRNLPFISHSDFFILLDCCQLSDHEKLDVLRLYHDFNEYHRYTNALLAQTKDLILDFMPGIDEEIVALMEKLTEMLENGGKGLLDEANITLDDKHSFIIYPGIYKVNTFSIWGMGFSDYYNMCVGKHCLAITKLFKEEKNEDKETEAFLKCLSDNTKLSILKLLKEGPMYGGQLAEILECTAANISHHASALLSLGIIRMEKESNKIYMHLDKEKIIQHIDDLKGLF